MKYLNPHSPPASDDESPELESFVDPAMSPVERDRRAPRLRVELRASASGEVSEEEKGLVVDEKQEVENMRQKGDEEAMLARPREGDEETVRRNNERRQTCWLWTGIIGLILLAGLGLACAALFVKQRVHNGTNKEVLIFSASNEATPTIGSISNSTAHKAINAADSDSGSATTSSSQSTPYLTQSDTMWTTALYYTNEGRESACGTWNEDSSMIFSVPSSWWNPSDEDPGLCGKRVRVWNPLNNYTILTTLLDNMETSEYADKNFF
ncbi:hypothetical protein MNV49_005925 [Pseudohyphozyma bogoriensis]|nr:hypothetical protein MNV49_005925 [Pseudohyphozyma bogoriensis]